MKKYAILFLAFVAILAFAAVSHSQCVGGACPVGGPAVVTSGGGGYHGCLFIRRAPVRRAVARVIERRPVRRAVARVVERRPVRSAVARVIERRPVRSAVARVIERRPVRRALARPFRGRCFRCR